MKIFNIFKKTNISTENPAINLFFQTQVRKGYGWNSAKGLDFFLTSVYVNRAIEKRALKVGEVDLLIKKGEELIYDHELLDLFSKPNNRLTGEQFFALWQKFYDIYGSAYILILKDREFLNAERKIQLELLDPRKCEPIFTKLGEFNGVKYDSGTTYIQEEVIYDYNPDPSDQRKGLSLLRAGANLIQTQIDLDALNAQLAKSGGKVDGIINFKSDSISPTQMKEFQEKYKEQLERKEDYGNLVFLGGDANYQKVALSPEELGYLETRKAVLNDICILTDVPKILLNSTDDVKYDNANASINLFLRETITPLIRQKVAKLNEKLELVPEELELTFQDPAPEDTDRKIKINESGYKGRYLTVNELRENMGYDEIEGGDEITKPTPREEREDEKQVKKKDFIHPLKSYEFRREYHKKQIAKEDKFEAEFLKVLKKYLEDQEKRLIEAIGETKRGKLRKDLIDSSFNIQSEIKIGRALLFPYLKDYMMKAGEDARLLVDSAYGFVWTIELESSLSQRADFFLRSINETTFKRVKEEFKESLSEGESRPQLISRLSNHFEETYQGRARTIARTEVHASVQKGTFEGYKQAQMQIKIYVAVLDDATRDEHAEMDGEERPIDMPFSSGEMYPGEHSINCRCTI
jgi:HK97 family phage portal protein